MTEREQQQAVQSAVRNGKDPKTRAIIIAAAALAVIALVVAAVAGWSIYATAQQSANEGAVLGRMIQEKCDQGVLTGPECGQADEVEAKASNAPVVPAAPGKDGVDGQDGSPGPSGKPGRDGKDGQDGRDGSDGVDGTPGPPGSPGPSGAAGQPGTDGSDGADGRGVASVDCTEGTGTFKFTYTDGTEESVTCAPEPIESSGGA